jgi:hypothetical protein
VLACALLEAFAIRLPTNVEDLTHEHQIIESIRSFVPPSQEGSAPSFEPERDEFAWKAEPRRPQGGQESAARGSDRGRGRRAPARRPRQTRDGSQAGNPNRTRGRPPRKRDHPWPVRARRHWFALASGSQFLKIEGSRLESPRLS